MPRGWSIPCRGGLRRRVLADRQIGAAAMGSEALAQRPGGPQSGSKSDNDRPRMEARSHRSRLSSK